MAIFSKFLASKKGIFTVGGIMTAGVVCLVLNKNELLPSGTYPISYSIFATGLLGVVLSFKSFLEGDDPDHDERMAEFDRLRPVLERHIQEHVSLNLQCLRYESIKHVVDEMESASEAYERIISAYEQRRANAVVVELRVDALSILNLGRRHSLQLKDLARLSRFYCIF